MHATSTVRLARHAAFRLSAGVALRWAGVGAAVGALAGVGLVAVSKIEHWAVADALAAGGWPGLVAAPMVLGCVVGAVVSIVRWVGVRRGAAVLDKRLSLRDRLSNAVELAGGGDPVHHLVIADAEATARKVSARSAVPIRVGRGWMGALGAAAVALAAWQWLPAFALWSPAPQSRVVRSAVAPAAAEQARGAVQDAAKAMEQFADASAARQVEQLRKVEEELAGRRASPEAVTSAARAVGEAGDSAQQRAAEAQREQQRLLDALAQAANAGADGQSPHAEKMREMARALRRQDPNAAAEAARELGDALDQASPEEQALAEERLRELAKAMEEWDRMKAADAAERASRGDESDRGGVKEWSEEQARRDGSRDDAGPKPSPADGGSREASGRDAERFSDQRTEPGVDQRDAAPPGDPRAQREATPDAIRERGEPAARNEGQAKQSPDTARDGASRSASEPRPDAPTPPEKQNPGDPKPPAEPPQQPRQSPDALQRQDGKTKSGEGTQGQPTRGRRPDATRPAPAPTRDPSSPPQPVAEQQRPKQGEGERKESTPRDGSAHGERREASGTEPTPNGKQEEPSRGGSDAAPKDQRGDRSKPQENGAPKSEPRSGQPEQPGASDQTRNNAPTSQENQPGGESPSTDRTEQGHAPTDPAPNAPPPGSLPSKEVIERLAERLRSSDAARKQAQELMKQGKDLEAQARKMLEQASPEQRQALERLAKELAQNAPPQGDAGGDGAPPRAPRGGDGPLGPSLPVRERRSRTAADATTVPVDARHGSDGSAQRVISDILPGDDPARGAPASQGAVERAFQQAAEGAESGIENQTVPAERSELVRRVFQRYQQRVKPASTAPTPPPPK